MGLRKGMTNNKQGKPKGAVNKLNKDMRQTIADFLTDHWSEVEKEFSKLKGRDKVNFYRDLLQYSIPKMQAVAVEMEFGQLSEENIDRIIDKLSNNNKDES
jgi:hypothetical protein